jgi:hypothetical protein
MALTMNVNHFTVRFFPRELPRVWFYRILNKICILTLSRLLFASQHVLRHVTVRNSKRFANTDSFTKEYNCDM